MNIIQNPIPMQAKAVKVLAITSGKGGVGKTSIAVNLAVALARKGQSVMLLDADLGLANVGVLFGINPQRDLSHVIAGECALSEIVLEGPFGIRIIPAASGVEKMSALSTLELAGLIHEFEKISDSVDVLIVDTASGLSNAVINFNKAAQEIIVVVCDEPASVMDAYALIKVLNRDHGIKRFQVLANMVKGTANGRSLYSKLSTVADRFMQISLGYLGCIPMDGKLRQAIQAQVPVVEKYPASPSALALQTISRRVLDLAVPSVHSALLLRDSSAQPTVDLTQQGWSNSSNQQLI